LRRRSRKTRGELNQMRKIRAAGGSPPV
jgi:hypothetical protein